VGFPKDGDPRASYALVQADPHFEVEIRRVPYDIDQAAAAVLAAGLPAKAAEDLRRGGRREEAA
ncbi:MAG: metallophosphoesterase, partial [Deltaproteobacteria bacterium]|nr:metallophosphoesterase [Deltaproteobacteria bacterium]